MPGLVKNQFARSIKLIILYTFAARLTRSCVWATLIFNSGSSLCPQASAFPNQTEMAGTIRTVVSIGFTTIPDIYTSEEVDAMIDLIIRADTDKETFRKSVDLFAIRQFLKELPEGLGLS